MFYKLYVYIAHGLDSGCQEYSFQGKTYKYRKVTDGNHAVL